VILALALSVHTRAAAPDAEAILRRAEEVRSPALDYAVDFKLVAEDPDTSWRRREAAYSLIAHGKDHSLVLMREPPQFYPGTLLIAEGRYWMLMPRSTMALELSPRQALDGDIANGDLARGNLLRDYLPRWLGSQRLRGQEAHQLELTRRHARAFYPRIVCWVAKHDSRPLRFDYYGQTDALLKTAWYEDYRQGPLGLRAMRIVVENQVRQGEKTTMTFSDLRPFDVSHLAFTLEGLTAFRDRALAVRGGSATSPLEELTGP
jgi:hypothetical protein